MKSCYNIIGTREGVSLRKLLLLMLTLCVAITVHAQGSSEEPEEPAVTDLPGSTQSIKIAGSVYGGGNAGNTGGSSKVTVRMADIYGSVFGGARMANVAGSTFVNIDGENAPENTFVLINRVYGGNDIAGTIGTLEKEFTPPTELTGKTENGINGTWNAFVRVSTREKEDGKPEPNQRVYLGQLYGGGNGEYYYQKCGDTHYIYASEADYKHEHPETPHEHTNLHPVASNTTGFIQPSIDRTYLEIVGGSIVYAYGGGNNATINKETVIFVDNPSQVVNSVEENVDGVDVQLLTPERIQAMGVNTVFSHPTSGEYQIGSFFGGNNKADMAIRPKWNLKEGKIRNLYSGGNEGNMTSPDGLLLEVRTDSKIEIDNLYGGCRKADVKPLDGNGNLVASIKGLPGYDFPDGFAARTIVRGCKNINNVYGGNDISGRVYFGNAIGVYTSIAGNVYGGGNGAYPYTNSDKLTDEAKRLYGDFIYNNDVEKAKEKVDNPDFEYTPGKEDVQALNLFRPNAEQVTLRLAGTEDKPTYIGGSVYVGGNNATLKPKDNTSLAELKIGSYVYADEVFLGNNGVDMTLYNDEVKDNVTGDVLVNEGVLKTYARTDLTTEGTFNPMILKGEGSVFGEYMMGCALKSFPSVIFDNEDPKTDWMYDEYSSYFGSFYCGGNVGSLTADGKITIDFNHSVVIYNKLVGGSNKAYVPASDYNDEFVGGVLGSKEESTGDKLVLNLAGLKIRPMRWKDPNDMTQGLIWNTQIDGEDRDPVTGLRDGESYPLTSDSDDRKRRLYGGNIYGGCCESGIVDGNVIINLNATIVERDVLFDEVEKRVDDGEEHLYDENPLEPASYKITKRNTGVILSEQGMDVLASALNVFGGGKGKGTEIWGSTTINMNKGYVFQVFGGSEEGVIGKSREDSNESAQEGDIEFKFTPQGGSEITRHYGNNEAYSCYVNLKGAVPGKSMKDGNNEKMSDCEFIYGGSFKGPIAGNTVIKLGNGRIFNSFAGSCYADILGHTETYIGYPHTYKDETGRDISVEYGFPWVRDYVYGGNDLGGEIKGVRDFSNSGLVRAYTDGKRYDDEMLKASSYVEYQQGRVQGIFGGCYGTYDYIDEFKDYASKEPFQKHAFVNFRPNNADVLKSNLNNVVGEIYGAGQGYPGDGDADKMQNSSYVLVDIPDGMENFKDLQVFGAGAWSGLGMGDYVAPAKESDAYKAAADKYSSVIDLIRGKLAVAYGGSYKEGVTRRSVVNVPEGSTVTIGSIFGGAYGTETYSPCDVYEANVNYKSNDAILLYDPASNEDYQGAIYGGNNNERRTLYGRVNIGSKVNKRMIMQYKDEVKGFDKGQELNTLGTVYGAGRGKNTWSEYTLVNLKENAQVYEAYGGGQQGKVYNTESVQNYITNYMPAKWPEGTLRAGQDFTQDQWRYAWSLGSGYDVADYWTGGTWKNVKDGERGYTPATGKEYWRYTNINLVNPLVREAELDDRDFSDLTEDDKDLVMGRYSANVIINENAKVLNYAYGGGYGADAVVSGTTYIALLGGEVGKDIYAGGTSGSVEDYHAVGAYDKDDNPGGFMASATAYIKGGTVRNVYGGGWRGSVGHHGNHSGTISDVENNVKDRDGESHVVIGDINGTSHTSGIPSITRNVYGGGEGGAIFGDARVTINKGYIGYRYKNTGTEESPKYEYVEELDDAEEGDNLLDKGGNVFGGGYVANSYVDRSHVTMLGGIVRGSLYGGGEIGPIGRGTVHPDSLKLDAIKPYIKHNFTGSEQPAAIYKGGSTEVYLYNGHVMRDVFGGGRGYDNWNGDGYMTEKEQETMDRSSKGYVFGKTNVYIRGGEIGTKEGALYGYGNVFAAGNEGFVYSDTGVKTGVQSGDDDLEYGKPKDGGGFYYIDGDKTKDLSLDCNVTIEPYCKVKEGQTVTIGSTTYPRTATSEDAGKSPELLKYVKVEDLNQLKNKNSDTRWEDLDVAGIVINNAVFAGGNITEGSDKLFANTTTVYGNVGASVRDVYNRDLISIGTDEIGGIYGDGNLTLVDGFREVHIDNYGTDYYSLDPNVDYAIYENMSEREQAYYQLKYVANRDHEYHFWESKSLHTYRDVAYRKGQKITQTDYNVIAADTEYPEEKNNWVQGKKYYKGDNDPKDEIDDVEWSLMDTAERDEWTLAGVFSIYAGRPMNTIQRADMCGVFGSRMVMKGAQDRVPQVVDYKDYTINRVDEVSLNQRTSVAGDTGENANHGNYFGIYNSVNFLGNLTSDVRFERDNDIRQTTSSSAPADETYNTYYKWKEHNPQSRYRNNGNSQNKVALASGVYLELKRTEGELTGEDDWGYITGVIELDLINVMQGMGGGYVYAKNEHGAKTYHSDYGKVTLLPFNNEARTYRKFTYNEADKQIIETSGNFVHAGKQIVDDCYPNSGIYTDGYVASPAHYWFIKGSIYVYDQYISAYTGSANAYAEKVELPLTIAAASNGRLTLREVQPNYYAYTDRMGKKLGTEGAEETLVINNKTYHLNDPISYWDYRLLSDADKDHFEEETYTTIAPCTLTKTDETTVSYPAGYTLLPSEYTSLKASASKKKLRDDDPAGGVPYVYHEVQKKDVDFDFVFRPSNNLSHNTGYVLTFDINNPAVWDNYYSKIENASETNKKTTKQYNELSSGDQANYTEGPTYTPKTGQSNVYGQKEIKRGAIINNSTKTSYDTNVAGKPGLSGQADLEQAWVVTGEISVKDASNNVVQILYPGVAISRHSGIPNGEGGFTNYTEDQWTAITTSGKAEQAKVCTSLLEFSATDYVWAGKVLSSSDIDALKTKIRAKYGNKWTEEQYTNYFTKVFENAWYCYSPGQYGGSYFTAGQAYRALESFCAMEKSERDKFDFNYDALDLLIDPTYSGRLEANYGNKPQYDGNLATKIYSVEQKVDYKAECTVACSYTDESGTNTVSYSASANQDNWLTREQYEDIPNEKRYYSPIKVTAPGDYYVANKVFMHGDVPYTAGQQIEASVYESFTSDQKRNVDVFDFTGYTSTQDAQGNYAEKEYYYCHQSYKVNEKGEGKAISTLPIKKNGVTPSVVTYDNGDDVAQGVIIREKDSGDGNIGYDELTNKQVGFVIHGVSPTEVSTLYVSSESDIYDLSKEKIITVIYLYEYDESDAGGVNVTPVSERHIVNIHINFKSGVPQIDELKEPSVVLPGTTVVMETPTFTEGAYRVTESGWELFTNQSDAETHNNGDDSFNNNETPLYWYQNGYWVAYYAKTYLGKTYSNPVQLKVANYHDLKKVMDAKTHHYYIDHQHVDYAPKIYINNYKVVDEEGHETGESQNGLDLLRGLIDLTYDKDEAKAAYGALNTPQRIAGGTNLEFFLRTDLEHSGSTPWTPIANNIDAECFNATLHGDGHTISGLEDSFINHLCGHIYNLGVSGSFTTGGIANTGDGYMENCWVKTTGTPADTHPLFGNPTETTYTQVANCYYLEDGDAKYTAFDDNKNRATKMSTKAFYNGEVTYDLNGFYLNKRYYEGTGTSEPVTPTDVTLTSGSKYVEDRYKDGDFIYADGTIPSSVDERAELDGNGKPITDVNGKYTYHPKWPNDYVFFGQTLNYGHVENVDHDELPSAIDAMNRVYRAPAYFGDHIMSVAHFNTNAVFAKTKKDDKTKEAYKGMTAIDFTGGNGDVGGGYKLGLNAGQFYAPLLDDGGITDFTNVDLTSNLLVYTGTGTTEATTTENTVKSKLTDKAYAEVNETYHTVAVVTDDIRGHWVHLDGGVYKGTRDHFLVDKEDFNAPIEYVFDGHRMWYQRMPDNYVEPVFEGEGDSRTRTTRGWEGVSLPFTAVLVTTNTKGEITHFYTSASDDASENDKGHEYWLRKYEGGAMKTGSTDIFEATFNKPESAGTEEDKNYKNSFLWDYYYKHNTYKDLNSDNYPGTYYKPDPDNDNIVKTYKHYPFLSCATPYIIGFPGERYYEFDLSGKFEAMTAYENKPDVLHPNKLGAQTITFVSATNERIHVSDTEMAGKHETSAGYDFVPNFTAKTISDGFILNTDGSSYDKTASATTIPFRPYFTTAPAGARQQTRSIIFSEEQTQLKGKDDHDLRGDEVYSLNIYAKRKKIVVESNLRETTEVRIVNTAGITINTFDIEPGETVETRINNAGIFIVQTTDGHYNKKLVVR